jgi:peptidoglycan/LPS O-acetylase OafA/YrhL
LSLGWVLTRSQGVTVGVLRLLLAISVVLDHSSSIAGQQLVGGRTAVECFFVISGFYMALVLENRYGRLGRRCWRVFMAARLGKLWPTYLLVLAVTAVVLAVGVPGDARSGAIGRLSPLGLLAAGLSNVTMVGQDLLLFCGVDARGNLFPTGNFRHVSHPGYQVLLIPQAWSISIELVFYACAPWIVRQRSRTICLLAISSLALRALLYAGHQHHDPWTYRFLPTELVYFLAGVLAYRHLRPAVLRSLAGPAAAGGAAAMVLSYQHVVLGREWGTIAFPFAIALLIPTIFTWSQHNHVDALLGNLSYPLYLVHLSVGLLLIDAGHALSGPLLLVTSLAATALLYLVVEKPLERTRQQRISRALSAQPG